MNENDQLKLLTKSAFIGQAHKLPNKNCSESRIENWQTGVTANLAEDETLKLESFKFLWRRDDHKKVATIPPRGIAGGIKQLVYLMADGRINREAVGIELDAWMTMLQTTEFNMESNNLITPAVVATPNAVKINFDKLVNYITTDYYCDPELAGATTTAYFADCKTSRKSMDKIFKSTELYIPDDLRPNFKNGAYGSWDAVVKAVLRLHGHDETQETVIDHFIKLREIIKSTKRMEVKVGKYRELLRKILVDSTDEKDMIKGKDFPGDMTAYQRVPEKYGPFANFIFQYMVFDKQIPEDSWLKIQTEYQNFIKCQSYKAWHENRPELYKIIDREVKRAKGKALSVSRHDDDTEINWTGSKFKKTRKQGQSRQKGYKNQKSSRQGSKQTGSKDKIDLKKAEKLLQRKCKVCSKFAKKIVLHKGPYNGGSNCMYTLDGKRRSRNRTMNEIEIRDENEESDQNNESGDESDRDPTEDELNYASSNGNSNSDSATEDDDDDTFAIYGVREGQTLPEFANWNGSPAIGAYE